VYHWNSGTLYSEGHDCGYSNKHMRERIEDCLGERCLLLDIYAQHVTIIAMQIDAEGGINPKRKMYIDEKDFFGNPIREGDIIDRGKIVGGVFVREGTKRIVRWGETAVSKEGWCAAWIMGDGRESLSHGVDWKNNVVCGSIYDEEEK